MPFATIIVAFPNFMVQCAEQMLAAAGQAIRVVAELLTSTEHQSADLSSIDASSLAQQHAALDLCHKVMLQLCCPCARGLLLPGITWRLVVSDVRADHGR